MISHRNMVTTCISSTSRISISNKDIYLSYLPMAHSLERNLFNAIIWHGSKIGIFGGDILKIKDDLAILKPTIFATVPRLFLRMYDTIN